MARYIGIVLTLGILFASSAGQAASDGDAYFVLGVSPAQARIVLAGGTVANGVFDRDAASASLTFQTHTDTATDGFVVGKIAGGTTLGLVSVSDTTNWPTVKYPSCAAHAKILTFTPPPGTVVYIANLKFRHTDGGFVPGYEDDIDDARAFLEVHDPDLAQMLKHGRYTLVTMAPCDPKG